MQAFNLTLRNSVLRLTRISHTSLRPAVTASGLGLRNLFTQQNRQVVFRHKVINTIRGMSSGPIYTVDYLSSKIQKELQAEHVDIEDLSNCGCGMKFDAVIVSPQFEGKPILQRQRLVNQTLAEEMKHIHAFTMRTLTPSQWKDNQSKKEQGNA